MTYSIDYFIAQLKSVSPDDVRKAFVKLSKEVHPDLHPELGQEPMQWLNEAYERVMKGWDGKTYKAQGKDDTTYDVDFSFDPELEKIFMEIIKFVQVHPYTDEIELIGAWIWVKGANRDECPFTCPKELMDSDQDPRPFWVSLDGTETKVRFAWSGGKNSRWYFDLRRLLTRKYDYKRRTRKGINVARQAYGSTRFDKKAPATGLPAYA